VVSNNFHFSTSNKNSCYIDNHHYYFDYHHVSTFAISSCPRLCLELSRRLSSF
jgi:hypothetical protein